MTLEFYEVDVICDNCQMQGRARIKKGKEVKDSPCDYCGCKTMRAKEVWTCSA